MKKFFLVCLAVLLFLCLFDYSFPQYQDVSFSSGLKIRSGARFEYFSREMTWDEKQHASKLKSTILALNLELEINEGFSVSALAGYTLSDYGALIFRQLPFSIEMEVGNIGGYIFGAEARKSLLQSYAIEVGLYGQFLYHMGRKKDWDIPGLNVSGTLTGKPTWNRASVGPYAELTSLESFTPYLSICYNNLWGKFELNQVIQGLEGTEEKELKSKSLIDVTLGSRISLNDYFFLRGEVHALPHGDGLDWGFVAMAVFSF